MGSLLIEDPDIIKKAKSLPYYIAMNGGRPDLVDDLRQDFWEAAWLMDDGIDIALAIHKLRYKLVDKMKSRTYHYSCRQKKSFHRIREVISVPCFSADLANDGDVGEMVGSCPYMSPGQLLFIREIELTAPSRLNEDAVESAQYFNWIEEERLSSIMSAYFYEDKTQKEVAKEHGLGSSMISKEIKRGLNVIRSHI